MAIATLYGSSWIFAKVGSLEIQYKVNELQQVRRAFAPQIAIQEPFQSFDLLDKSSKPPAIISVIQTINQDVENIQKIASRIGWQLKESGILGSIHFTTWIKSMKCEQIEEIDLSNLALSSIPPQISLCKRVKKLNLSSNNIRLFPPEILSLEDLEELDCSDNPFFEFPELTQLKKLKILKLNKIGLTSMPNWIHNLNLTSLECNGNRVVLTKYWQQNWAQNKYTDM